MHCLQHVFSVRRIQETIGQNRSSWKSAPLEVAGGTDIIKKTMEAFCIPTAKANALIDLHAYDGATALAAVEELIDLNLKDPKMSWDSTWLNSPAQPRISLQIGWLIFVICLNKICSWALSGDPAGALYYLCVDGVGEFGKWTCQPHLQSHIWTLSHKSDGPPVIPQLWPSGGSSSGRWCSDPYCNLQSVCAAARSVESAGEHGRQMDANGLCEGPGGEHDQRAQREIQSKRRTMGWRQENTCCCVMIGCRCSLLLFMPLSCKHVSLPVNSIYNH